MQDRKGWDARLVSSLPPSPRSQGSTNQGITGFLPQINLEKSKMTSYKEYYTAIKKVQYKNQKAKSMSRNKSKLSISLSKNKYYTPSLDHDQMKHVGRMMKNYKSRNDEETRKLRYENPYGNPFFDTVESPIKKHIE